jgi:hypothetical protein
MASIITATTSSGLTQSADNSGVLQLASGTGNLVTVPSVTGTAMVSGAMPAFSAYAGSATSLVNNTLTKVNFDTEEFDTNSNFASSRFTPTVAGYYQISAVVAMSLATFSNEIAVYKNGSVYKYGPFPNKVTSQTAFAGISCLVYCNGSTDYIEIYGFQESGGSLNTQTGSAYVWFQGCMLRSA